MTENTQPKIRNDFSKIVDAYAKYRRDYIDKVYDMIYAFCPEKESNVLDLGCGTGFVANHLAEYYKHITGVDKEASMVEVAKKTALKNVSFVVSPAENLPFKDKTFDLVTAAAAYHWFDHDLAGKEICRILKPNGKMCVFWKYSRHHDGYLPNFAWDNLKSFVSNVPKTNKESIGANIFSRVGFTKIDDKEFDFDEIYSQEEVLGYIQSHSTFNLLDDKQKEEYKRLNDESIKKHMKDGKFIFESRMEMWFIEK